MSIPHPSISPNTFSRPSTPKMLELQQFALTQAGILGNHENDVWTKTAEKAHELGKEAPTQLDIRRVLTQDMQRRFPGLDIGSPFANQAINPQVPVVAPKAKSKRTASEADIDDLTQRASRKAAVAASSAAAAARRAENDDPVLRSFSPFSEENLDKQPVEAIKAFNESRRAGSPTLKVGTSNYEKAKDRHSTRRRRKK